MTTLTLGVMIAPIEQETGWTRTEITSGPALISILSILLSTFAGMAVDRIGFRRIGLTAAFLMVLSTGLMSVVTDSLWTWLLCWGMFGLAATPIPGVHFVPIISTFNKSRGLALIVMGAGGAISSALAPLTATYLAANFGWRTGYVALALIWGCFVLPTMYFFFKLPGGVQEKSDGTAPAPAKPVPPGVTMREGFKSAAFYKLVFGGLFASLVGITMSMNMVPILTLDGMSRTAAAAAAGTMGVATLAGKFLGALVIDRVNPKLLCAGASMGSMAMPLLILAMPGNLTAAIIGIAIYGSLQGFRPAATLLLSRYIGVRSFGTMSGVIDTVSSIVIGIAPMAASFLYDTTHSYDLVMWLALPTLTVSALLYLSLGPYPDEAPQRAAIA